MANKKASKPEHAGKVIEIKCGYDKLYQYKDLTPSQGNLKTITKAATQKLINSIKNNGVVFPIYVWQHNGKNWIIGGHHRSIVIFNLQKAGYRIAGIPAVHIKANTMDEAKKFVLLDSAQYAAIDKKNFGDFLGELKLDDILSEVNNKEIELSDVTKQLMEIRYDQIRDANADARKMIVAFAVTKEEYKAIVAASLPKRPGEYARELVLKTTPKG
jgi:hypothetical protein